LKPADIRFGWLLILMDEPLETLWKCLKNGWKYWNKTQQALPSFAFFFSFERFWIIFPEEEDMESTGSSIGPTAGRSAAWPRSLGYHHFNRKFGIALQRSLFEPWPSQLQRRVGPIYF
jgi:hypothetical protein